MHLPASEVASDLVEQSMEKTDLEKAPQLIKVISRDLPPGPTGSTQEHTAAEISQDVDE